MTSRLRMLPSLLAVLMGACSEPAPSPEEWAVLSDESDASDSVEATRPPGPAQGGLVPRAGTPSGTPRDTGSRQLIVASRLSSVDDDDEDDWDWDDDDFEQGFRAATSADRRVRALERRQRRTGSRVSATSLDDYRMKLALAARENRNNAATLAAAIRAPKPAALDATPPVVAVPPAVVPVVVTEPARIEPPSSTRPASSTSPSPRRTGGVLGPRPELEELVSDWGRVSRSTEVRHRFLMRNSGDRPMVIERLRTPPGISAAATRSTVAAGCTVSIVVVIPAGRLAVGEAQIPVHVITQDARSDCELFLHGVVVD